MLRVGYVQYFWQIMIMCNEDSGQMQTSVQPLLSSWHVTRCHETRDTCPHVTSNVIMKWSEVEICIVFWNSLRSSFLYFPKIKQSAGGLQWVCSLHVAWWRGQETRRHILVIITLQSWSHNNASLWPMSPVSPDIVPVSWFCLLPPPNIDTSPACHKISVTWHSIEKSEDWRRENTANRRLKENIMF